MSFNNYQFNGYLRGMFSITTAMGRKENITDLNSLFIHYQNDSHQPKLDLVVKSAINDGINIFQELIYWSKQYDINYQNKIINPDVANLLIIGLESQQINLPNEQNIEVIDFYINNTSIKPNEQRYNKLLLIKLVHEYYPQYLDNIDKILFNWNQKAAFDKDKQLYIKEYLHSFSINLVEKFPELKNYYKSLETSQYLTSEELSHYRMNIDSNVIANLTDFKTKVITIKTMSALTTFLELLEEKQIFNYSDSSFSFPTYKKNKFDQLQHQIEIDFLFKDEDSKNVFKEVLVSFLDYVVENLVQPNAFTKDNIKPLVNKICLEKRIHDSNKIFNNKNVTNKLKI